MAKVALGFLETRGNTGNVFALDAMLKEAHVDLVNKIGIGGALVLDGELVSGRHGLSGGAIRDDLTTNNCELKDILGWLVVIAIVVLGFVFQADSLRKAGKKG